MTGRNDPCWCGSNKKWKKCHYPQLPPESADSLAARYYKQYQIRLKTPDEINKIRAACKLAKKVLNKTCEYAQIGRTTEELNSFAHSLILKEGAIPAALNYGHPPYPKSICISLNEVICHGIADDRVLVEGDIANIDVALILEGYYGDCSAMVVMGETTPERQLVVDVSYKALMDSIKILKPGLSLKEIGNTICDVAESAGCSVVHQFVGHGVGCDFHEAPQVMHSRNNIDIPLAPGMTFTIEPMINAGVAEGEIDPNDHWTARTLDGKASAQWEHTVLITQQGYEILTDL